MGQSDPLSQTLRIVAEFCQRQIFYDYGFGSHTRAPCISRVFIQVLVAKFHVVMVCSACKFSFSGTGVHIGQGYSLGSKSRPAGQLGDTECRDPWTSFGFRMFSMK